MIKNPTVYTQVPVRYTKGLLINEMRTVKVATIDWRNGTMMVEYETDMYDNGVLSRWSVTLPLDIFRKRWRV